MTDVDRFGKFIKFKDVNGKLHSMFVVYERNVGESEYRMTPEHKRLYEDIRLCKEVSK